MNIHAADTQVSAPAPADGQKELEGARISAQTNNQQTQGSQISPRRIPWPFNLAMPRVSALPGDE
jgi:hypothetical protein